MGGEKSLSEVYSDVVYSVSDLYSYTDLQRLLESNTRAAFREVGLKVDQNVVYFRIFLYLVMNAIGAYTTFFVHVEKKRFLLKVMLLLFAAVLSVYIVFDKFLLRCAHFRVNLKKSKVLVWSNVNKREGTFEIKYRRSGLKSKKEVYTVPLSELFFADGECDYPHFVKLVEKLKPKLVAMDTAGKKRD